MKRSLSVIFFFISFLTLSAQNYHISKPVLSFNNNILNIKYDITGCGRNELVNVSVIILNSKGDTIKPNFITGDLGLMVSCGEGKSIDWNLEKDNVKINDNIDVIIKGLKSESLISQPKDDRFSRGSIILSSALLPGWGLKKASGKPAYYAIGAAFLASAGASVYYAMKTAGLKQDYLDANDESIDKAYNEWQTSYNMSRLFAFGAVGIWAGNIIWSAVIPVTIRKTSFGLSINNERMLVSAKWNF